LYRIQYIRWSAGVKPSSPLVGVHFCYALVAVDLDACARIRSGTSAAIPLA